MSNETEATEANRPYAAFAASCVEGDMPLALQLYKNLMTSYPSAQEADYARMRAQN